MNAVLINLTIIVGFLSDQVLYNLAGRITDDYQRLADKLSVNKERVAKINSEQEDAKNRALEVLHAWNKANTKLNLYDMESELQEAFRDIGMESLAKDIHKS